MSNVDRIVNTITEQMLIGVVQAKYESLEIEMTAAIGKDCAAQAMELVKHYFPVKLEYESQLKDLLPGILGR